MSRRFTVRLLNVLKGKLKTYIKLFHDWGRNCEQIVDIGFEYSMIRAKLKQMINYLMIRGEIETDN